MAFTYVTVGTTYETAGDLPAKGTVTFTPVDQMRNGLTVISAPVTATLDVAGAISVRLAATTDPTTRPVGVTYKVVEKITGQPTRTYYVSVPHDQGATIELADLTVIEGGGPAGFALRNALDYDDSVAPTDGQVMTWDGSTSKFHPEPIGGGAGAVTSVNGQTGAVSITASGIGGQPVDTDLTAISALTPVDNDLLQRKAGAWTSRAPAQVKSDLALDQVDNTSDAAKPVSSATASALAGKAAASHTHPVTDLAATGTPGSGTFLRGDGQWAAGPGGAVTSVNGQIGAVVLTPDSFTDGTTNHVFTAEDDVKLASVAAGATAYTDEQAEDAAARLLTTGSHTGLSAGYDDASGRLNLAVTGGSANPTAHPSDADLFSFGSTSATPATAPGAPTIGSVSPGSGQVTVSFTPPASNGGAAISSYTVTATPGGQTGSGSASPIVVTGLANGTAYTFRVKATNSAGTGPESAASGQATPTAATAPAPVAGSSTPARWQIDFGGAPHCRVTWETGVVGGQAQVVWVASMPDVRARTSKLETGVAAQAQDAWQAYIQDLSTGLTVADSGVVFGTASSWTATNLTPVAGRRYKGYARVRAADGQWSAYSSTRFVAPTGVVRYFEDFGMVGDGTTRSGTDYATSTWLGPLRTAIGACDPGDVLRSNAPGVVGTGSVSGTALTASTVSLTGRAGQKIMIYGAGKTDATGDAYVHRTTIASVSSATAATLTAAAPTALTGARIMVNYPEFWVGHIDIDGSADAGTTGGVTIDGTGCLFTSLDPNYAGFRTAGIPDMTYKNIHYWVKNTTTRGNGQNNNNAPWFIENAAAVGTRIIGCYAENAKDAGILFFGGPSDAHVVDCIADHTRADPFHTTGTAADIQFVRCTSVYCGDDGIANIGYRTDGDAARPQRITWEAPTVIGQDWGRGLSFGGCKDCLATDVTISDGAMASFLIGADADQANTEHVQVRRFTVTNPKGRVGLKPTYTQGAGTSSTISNDAPIKLLSRGTPVRQRDILVEDGTIVDPGFAAQVVVDGGGAFQDGTIIMRGISLTGSVSAGLNWRDENTYPGHLDWRGITVPAGSTPSPAPTAANS